MPLRRWNLVHRGALVAIGARASRAPAKETFRASRLAHDVSCQLQRRGPADARSCARDKATRRAITSREANHRASRHRVVQRLEEQQCNDRSARRSRSLERIRRATGAHPWSRVASTSSVRLSNTNLPAVQRTRETEIRPCRHRDQKILARSTGCEITVARRRGRLRTHFGDASRSR